MSLGDAKGNETEFMSPRQGELFANSTLRRRITLWVGQLPGLLNAI